MKKDPTERVRLRGSIDDMIDTTGWMVMSVFEELGKFPQFAHTIGLTGLHLPELIIIGQPHPNSGGILNSIAKWMIEHGAPKTHVRLRDVFAGRDAVFVETTREYTDEHMVQAKVRYPNFRALQLVWPDKHNKFPWEPGFDSAVKRVQPLLFPTVH